MLNVLLVGGEQETIKILNSYIENYTQECQVIPVDPTRVLHMAESHSHALLVADMDVLKDPVDLIRQLGKHCPDVKSILYAAIGNSELLQQCMRFDIFDYMYKPLKQSEFLRCLQRAIDFFNAQEQRRIEDAHTAEAYESERDSHAELFVKALLEGWLADDGTITDGLKYFRTALGPDFCVLIVEIDRYDHRHESMMQTFKVKRLVEGSFRSVSCRLCDNSLAGVTVILSGKHTQAYIVEECEKLKKQALEHLDMRISIGIGSSYESPSGIVISYREARAALGYRSVLGYNAVIPIRVAEPFNSVGYAYPEESERMFIDSIVMGAYDNCVPALKSITGALNDSMPISKIVTDILHTIDRRAAERGIDIRFDKRFHKQDIYDLLLPTDVYEYLISAAQDISALISGARADADATLVKRATEYLKAHYYEYASAAKLAVTFGTTTEHFERVFEEHENMGVYEYAARLRLDEAKSLIRKSSMDDEMVAIKVGYDDVRQFRNEFREYENMSVREFRLSMRTL